MTQTAYRRQVPMVSWALVLLICGVSVMGARVQSERNSLRSAVLNPDAGATKATNGTVSNSDSSNTTSASNTTTASNGTSSTSNGTNTRNSSTETASVKNSTSVNATVEKPSNQTKANSTVEVKEAGNASVSSNTTVSNSTSKTSTVNATKEPSTPTVDKGEPKTVSPDDRVCPVASCSVEWGQISIKLPGDAPTSSVVIPSTSAQNLLNCKIALAAGVLPPCSYPSVPVKQFTKCRLMSECGIEVEFEPQDGKAAAPSIKIAAEPLPKLLEAVGAKFCKGQLAACEKFIAGHWPSK